MRTIDGLAVLRHLLEAGGVAVAEPVLVVDGALRLVPKVGRVVEGRRRSFDLHLRLRPLEGWKQLPLLLA